MTQTTNPLDATTRSALPAPRTNTMAVMALIFAFVVSPLGIVFGAVARRQIRRTGEGGRGLATAGLVLGIAFTLVGVLTTVAVLVLARMLPTTLDLTPVEEQISRSTTSAAGVAPTDLTCPTDVTARAGDVFTCTASVDGQPTRYTITQTDDSGHVTFISDTFVVVATVARELSAEMAEKSGADVGATCDAGGRTVFVGGAGTSFPCTVVNAADPSDTVDFTATITDDRGKVSFAPVG